MGHEDEIVTKQDLQREAVYIPKFWYNEISTEICKSQGIFACSFNSIQLKYSPSTGPSLFFSSTE